MGNRIDARKIGEEYPPPGEDAAINGMVDFVFREMNQTDPHKRGSHAKGHGCVQAEFTVLDDLPDDLRHGLFRNPGTYPALIRFSNAFSPDDRLPDFHGFAIKLFGVPGAKLLDDERESPTQDFLMIDSPAFFVANVQRFLVFLRDKAKLETERVSPSDIMQRLAQTCPVEVALFGKYARRAEASPLVSEYWSCAPYALGTGAVKYHASPTSPKLDVPSATDSADYLHLALVEHLITQQQPAAFDFFVQRQLDPETMPIEDATIEWDSPFERVAKIAIPPQRFTSQPQMTFAENLSLNPWHALPEHRPLGGLNRVRRAVYWASQELRHQMNQVPLREPLSIEEFLQ